MQQKKLEGETAVDDRGRRRFHGAFTGGFSAGYFNTVGSKEGMCLMHVVLAPKVRAFFSFLTQLALLQAGRRRRSRRRGRTALISAAARLAVEQKARPIVLRR